MIRTPHQCLGAIGLALLVLLPGLTNGAEPEKDTKAEKSGKGAKITYDDHIAPLFRQHCSACHNQDKKKGGLAVNTYSLLMEGGSSGVVIKPGEAESSRLFALVSHQETPHMPPKKERLADAPLALIESWIQGGALENKGSKARISKKPRVDLKIQGNPGAKPDGPPPMPRGVSLEPSVVAKRGGAVIAMATNPWSPLVAIGGQRQVLLYNTAYLELTAVLPFPEGDIKVLKFSRNGSLLLAAGGRGAALGKVIVWNVQSGERVLQVGDEFDSVLAADISADHSLIALGGPGRLVKIYSTEDGSLLHSIKKHSDWVTSLAFSPDGVLLASGDRNGALFVWESRTAREYLNLRGHSASITKVAWRIDSNVLASCSEDRTVRLWEMENGRAFKRWNAHGGGTLSLDFAKDGRIATSGRDRKVNLWDQNGKRLRGFEPFGDLALALAIDWEGKRLIAGDFSGEVRVWSMADGKRAGTLSTNPPRLATRIAQLEKLTATEKSSVDALRAAASQLETRLLNIEEQLKEATSITKSSAAKIGAARGRRSKADKGADAARKRLEKALKSLTAIEASKEASDKTKVQAARKELSDASAKLPPVLGEQTNAQTAAEQLQAKVDRATRIRTELQPQVKTTRDESTKKKAELGTVTKKFETTQSALLRWQSARHLHLTLQVLADHRQKLSSLNAKQDELQSQIASLEQVVNLQKNEEKKASAEAQVTMDALGQKATKQLGEARGLLAALTKAIEKAEEQAEDVTPRRIVRAIAQLEKAEQLTVRLEKTAAGSKGSLTQAGEAAETAKSKVAAIGEKMAGVASEIKLVKEQMKLVGDKIPALQKLIEATKADADKKAQAYEAAAARARGVPDSAKITRK